MFTFDQADESIDHLLIECVFSRQFWYYILRQVGIHSLAPQPSDTSFDDWWEKASAATSGLTQKGLNSLIVLEAWIIWNHRNSCVFDGANPNIAETLKLARDERRRWTMAGAHGLSHLTAPAQAVS